MSTQGGLKHAATEPAQLDNKRERRRGAAGRAAVLRRAPSDSDCSGETASLSADSGDRVLRPAPPPPRANKTRSRRRGSEWEVLEGLKDGQRFDRRPEVFNGYLHKKRKWPLKGWHKRFFVVDGGILVYARSPTDVARGRLHGSVDVGLSVISAKARRRRIDIDADEFIYHLRAKTPDVFRTWLTVLKAHRLYRQHLLTFGARESAPKIHAHAPLEDIPNNDTSSRTSDTSVTKTSKLSELFNDLPSTKLDSLSGFSNKITYYNDSSTLFNKMTKNPLEEWCGKVTNDKVMPQSLEFFDDDYFGVDHAFKHHNSMCSMNCLQKITPFEDLNTTESPNVSLALTETEQLSTELNLSSYTAPKITSTLLYECSINSPNCRLSVVSKTAKKKSNKRIFFDKKAEPTAALYFFKKRSDSINSDSFMKKSQKCTNLVKYRNLVHEPPLKKPLSKNMLLGQNRSRLSKQSATRTIEELNSFGNTILLPAQPLVTHQNMSIQDSMTISEFDYITERLINSVLQYNKLPQVNKSKEPVKHYIHQIVRELYDIKWNQNDVQPVKKLFKCLLEYWLKHSSIDHVREAMRCVQSVDRPSNKYFTRDKNMSSVVVSMECKETQYEVESKGNDKKTDDKSRIVIKTQGDSYEKDKRIQQLERLLKNTVYLCETVSKEKDIEITKRLISNLDKIAKKDPSDYDKIWSNSSTELPQIQETISHLISDTAIPPDIAKEFLGAYLEVLLENSESYNTDNSPSTEDSKEGKKQPQCDVQAESIQRKFSKSITTFDKIGPKNTNKSAVQCDDKNQPVDPGQLYLQSILDKITTIFSSTKKSDTDIGLGENANNKELKDELGRLVAEYSLQNTSDTNNEEEDVIIDLSKYDLEHISMVEDAKMQGRMAITIKLKEKPSDFGESKPKNLSFKFSDENLKLEKHCKTNNKSFEPRGLTSPFINFVPNANQDRDVKLHITTSDATSKRVAHDDSDPSIEMSYDSSCANDTEQPKSSPVDTEEQSCYIISALTKNNLMSKFQSKKESDALDTNITTATNHPDISVFEKPTPKFIDEKFILLLLENLAMLSKNVPSLYKDINSMYLKLRKRYEKNARHNCEPGLSLLGKIYNDSYKQSTADVGIQVTPGSIDFDYASHMASTATNTSLVDVFIKDIMDKSLSAYTVPRTVADMKVQTELFACDCCPIKDGGLLKAPAPTISVPSIEEVAGRCAEQMWCEMKENVGLSTAIKCIFDRDHESNFKFVLDEANPEPMKPKNKDKKQRTFRRNVINEIGLLAPSYKVSTKSQTESKLFKCLKEKSRMNSFNVYFLSKEYDGRASSLTNCNESVRSDDLKTIYRCSSDPSYTSGLVSPTSPPLRGPQAGFVSGTPGGRLASWIIESGGPLESASRELGQAQLSVQQLQRLLDTLELQHQVHHDTDVSLEGASPNVKNRRKFGLRKKKSNSKCASIELAPPAVDGSTSHLALSALTAPPSPGGGASSVPNSAASLPIACAAARPQSLPGAEALGPAAGPASLTSLTPDQQLREDFTVLAKDLLGTLKGVVTTLVCERSRLRAAMEAAEATATPGSSVMTALRTNLSSALQQNSELRSRLARIHDASDLADLSSVNHNDQATRPFQQSLSYSSSCVSASEFFDAEEHDDELKPNEILEGEEPGVIELDGDSSSEAGSMSSEEGSASSDNSDGAMATADRASLSSPRTWTRRCRLPVPRPTPGGPSLWNLLYKNIGKDLSQISMPVTINEPLNMLQRLCEELEYSELLDSASECKNDVERMALIAAFAVSAYASSAHRAASKPFNPLLGETYECIRDDKGFRFIAEQVSHHPPISACHAESPRWVFWQEARIKTKFWGKSMEFQPAGRVHVRLNTTGDHYSWNKVTTCVHNLFGGQRWVDQYGDMLVVCHGTDVSCKLNFIKASSWSSSRHEVRGGAAGGGVRLRLHGRWSEGLFAGEPPAARCLWRPGALPAEHEMYYGFTRFATELNELEPGMADVLPHTDTRLRPDQRALELGDVEAAERHKRELEQAQRDRRRDLPPHTPAWFRKSSENGEEMWVFTGEYWRTRQIGFGADCAPRIW